ncbi:MAG: ferritin family protein [Syntrophales bacterium]|jgi:rubrerythrin|nr:ferritin family protein [Syntrophales bacterium]
MMSDGRLDALKRALKMEEDGKKFYEKCLRETKNDTGRWMFEFLIRAEESHIRKFNELYKTLESSGNWPKQEASEARDVPVNIFAEALVKSKDKEAGTADDIEAIKTAAGFEEDGIKYYQSLAAGATDPMEKKFYMLLVNEETEHFLSLMDSLAFMENPQLYYHQKEMTRGHW